jgi:hypothetical protein
MAYSTGKSLTDYLFATPHIPEFGDEQDSVHWRTNSTTSSNTTTPRVSQQHPWKHNNSSFSARSPRATRRSNNPILTTVVNSNPFFVRRDGGGGGGGEAVGSLPTQLRNLGLTGADLIRHSGGGATSPGGAAAAVAGTPLSRVTVPPELRVAPPAVHGDLVLTPRRVQQREAVLAQRHHLLPSGDFAVPSSFDAGEPLIASDAGTESSYQLHARAARRRRRAVTPQPGCGRAMSIYSATVNEYYSTNQLKREQRSLRGDALAAEDRAQLFLHRLRDAAAREREVSGLTTETLHGMFVNAGQSSHNALHSQQEARLRERGVATKSLASIEEALAANMRMEVAPTLQRLEQQGSLFNGVGRGSEEKRELLRLHSAVFSTSASPAATLARNPSGLLRTTQNHATALRLLEGNGAAGGAYSATGEEEEEDENPYLRIGSTVSLTTRKTSPNQSFRSVTAPLAVHAPPPTVSAAAAHSGRGAAVATALSAPPPLSSAVAQGAPKDNTERASIVEKVLAQSSAPRSTSIALLPEDLELLRTLWQITEAGERAQTGPTTSADADDDTRLWKYLNHTGGAILQESPQHYALLNSLYHIVRRPQLSNDLRGKAVELVARVLPP